ncbi:MAG: hypothetical protein H0X37_20345 [Herpetosiphonaceae bacterium]|nr:hypothetical protein [Herpetosiphonaceae bacterium]
MQKRKIDLRQLYDNQLARWPQRRVRLAEIRRLGAAALQARSSRLRAEHFMVALAVLMLFLAIVLSSVLSPSPPKATTPQIVALNPTFSRTVTITGTTLGIQPQATQVAGGTATTVSTVAASSSITGTVGSVGPYPGISSGPVGIGTPPASLTGPTPAGGTGQPLPTFQPIPGTPANGSPPNGGSLPPATGAYPGPKGSQPGFPTPPPITGSGSGAGQPYPGANAPPPNVPVTTPVPSIAPNGGGFPPATVPHRGFTPVPQRQPPTARPAPSSPPVPTTANNNGYPGPNSGGSPATSPPTQGAPGSNNGGPATAPTLQPTASGSHGGSGTVVVPAPTHGATPPTSTPTETAPPPTATSIPPTPTATAIPVTVLSGNVHWTVANSPITLPRDTLVAAGASVQVDPGVEVQLAPGVQLAVVGNLQVQGTSAAPVRFTGPSGRWAGIFGQVGSTINLRNTELHQAGQGGVALGANGGTLHVYNSLITDSGGGVSTTDSTVDIEHTRITGNNLPSAPAVLLGLGGHQTATLVGNIVGGNQLSRGTPQVKLQIAANGSGPLRIEGNLITATNGTGLDLTTAAPLGGTVRCNGFVGGTTGLAINASTPSNKGFGLALDTNSFSGQVNYGASSTIALSAANNWWSDPSGPYDAQANAQGKGERVGVNLQFKPWLTAHPACAPTP